MDFFGIGAAVKSMVFVYRQSARGSGRSTILLDSVEAGDRIYFANDTDARIARNALRERGELHVDCMVVPVSDPSRMFGKGTPTGKAIFDHRWVEEYYEMRINQIAKDIDYFERESSGYGYVHRETRQKAIEMSKWSF